MILCCLLAAELAMVYFIYFAPVLVIMWKLRTHLSNNLGFKGHLGFVFYLQQPPVFY